MHTYRMARTLDGVAAGEALEIRYGVVIQAQFISGGKETGPCRDL